MKILIKIRKYDVYLKRNKKYVLLQIISKELRIHWSIINFWLSKTFSPLTLNRSTLIHGINCKNNEIRSIATNLNNQFVNGKHKNRNESFHHYLPLRFLILQLNAQEFFFLCNFLYFFSPNILFKTCENKYPKYTGKKYPFFSSLFFYK